MALTQSARLPGPSWDEEVVPALRKRLESESRTLARRMSAISLSSVDEPSTPSYPPFSDNVHRKTQPTTLSNSLQSSGNHKQKPGYQPQPSSDRTTITAPSRATPTNNSNGKPPFQRARTYSSPYASNPDGPSNGTRPKLPPSRTADASRSLSPRPIDVKPTRIPKVARPSQVTGNLSNSSSPYTNGYSHSTAVTPDLSYHPPLDQRAAGPGQRDLVASSSTKSTIELAGHMNNQNSVLLNEPPPFAAASSASSAYEQEQDPPRPSMESEERPYEHWYRGEVSRNGGVGELRVGRRQEMLDIANYGHLIRSQKASAAKGPPIEPTVRTRKRAGSIAGITNMERQRESLYLDDERADEVGRVLDEHPLTDLDGEGSDINSISDRGMVAYAYLPDVGDAATPTQQWTDTAGAHELRSTTPTPNNIGPRTTSRQAQNLPPTRIPGPSSRRSSESRSTATTMSPSMGGPSRSTEYTSSSSFTTPSPPQTNLNPANSRQQPYASHTVPAGGQKRGPSPASKKPRTVAGKATRAKIQNAKEKDQQNRESVAQYPTPGEGDEEDMADAIPSWTQPVPREGNWDEVVLPVVARKKGLDGHYENANGSAQPKKGDAGEPAPAPGTFGFDHSKYRPPRVGDFETIPMDEFGRPARPVVTREDEEHAEKPSPINEKPSPHDETRLPVRQPPPASPVPFAQYAPTAAKRADLEAQISSRPPPPKHIEEEEKDAGCCQCVIM